MENIDTSVQMSIPEGRKMRARNPREARATYWWTEVDGERIRHWNSGRSRGIEKADRRLGGALGRAAATLLDGRDSADVLEVGCGYGRVLLELRATYRERLTLHGINVEPGYNEQLLREFARDQELDVPDVPFPTIHVHDADHGLPFADGTFDLVFSVATFHSIRDKVRFLAEVSRTLRPGGIGLIEFPTASSDMVGNPVPPHYRQRMEVWNQGRQLDPCEWLASSPAIDIGTSEEDPHIVVRPAAEGLGLEADLVAHFFLPDVCETWWGCQSIYRVRGPRVTS